MNKTPCHFTTNIADMFECSHEDKFDHNGFAVKQCPKFPCKKFKELEPNWNDREIERNCKPKDQQ
jgi:glutathione peroxidase-family protein